MNYTYAVWLGIVDIFFSLAYAFYTSLEVQQRNLSFFTKRFNHTAVVFFSGNNTIKHINRHFIGTQTVKTEKIGTRQEVSSVHVAACSVHTRGRGVGTNECIIHMRQDAFLPVKGVGLTPHGLQASVKA